MKKYLMTGIAALAMGGLFTSCGPGMDTYGGNPADYVKQSYEQKFIQAFGEPAPNQTWGFGSETATVAATRGMTRSNPGDTYPQTNEGINANGNEWADPDKYYGGWQVPDPLTEGQKERVMKYFQANPNLSFEDPHFRHFFVQQVYKGGTSSPSTTPESITAANNSTYNSSHMNKLTVGQNNLHINNFNSGDCSVYGNVLDNGQTVNGGTTHSDKIQLMVNIDDTSCFGYYESGASIQVNNKAALVSAATIDAWAAANGNPGEAVVDKWNRSFLGFDHALKEGEDALENVTVKYNDGPDSYNYAMIDGEIVSINGNDEIKLNGNSVRFAATNTNMYVASEKKNIGDGDIQQDYRVNGQYMGKYFNYDKIMELLNAGWTPVKDKSLREWVKIGTSDGYFSDWIVSLAKAKRYVVTEDIRVIAEDLSVNQTTNEKSDFDFNDIVFDVKWDRKNNKVYVEFLAAGGELPIFIGKDKVNEGDEAPWELHELFKEANPSKNIGAKTMMNTYAGQHHVYTCPEKELPSGWWSGSDIKTIAYSIMIRVKKSTATVELEAIKGKAASKIAVDTDYEWCDERQGIDAKYFGEDDERFTKYVGGQYDWNTWYKK